MAKFPTCISPHSELHVYTPNLQSYMVVSSRLLVKIAAYMNLVSIGLLLRLAFLYGWRFLNKISLEWPLTLTVYFKTFWQPWVHHWYSMIQPISLFNFWALLSHLAFNTPETLYDISVFLRKKNIALSNLHDSSTLLTKSNNLLHFELVTYWSAQAISLVIQTFERTYKSLITAGYRLGLHNSISLYICIFYRRFQWSFYICSAWTKNFIIACIIN